MLRTESMILQARQAFGLDISDESVEDIGKIDQLSSIIDQGDASPIETIRVRWDKILEALREHSKVTWILLNSATIASLNSDALTIEFRHDGDARGFISAECDRQLSEVLKEETGLVRWIRATSPTGAIYEGERATLAIPGETLRHASYGLGRVISVGGPPDDPEAMVDFGEEYGVKRLLLRYAPLRRVKRVSDL
jgi:hypothetical protein